MINWTLIIAGAGFISSLILSIITLARTIKQSKRNRAAENLDEIFEGNQKLLENYAKDNEALRKRVSDLENEMAQIKHEKQVEIDSLTTERNDLSHKLLKSQANEARLIKQLEGGMA